LKTTISLFQRAGVPVFYNSRYITKGIYITNAVKTPKSEYTIEKSSIEKSLPYLESEIALFPDVKVVMLMGESQEKRST
jgi:uracil-DNA glycosylase